MQEEIENQYRPMLIKEIESIISKLPKLSAPVTDGFTDDFSKTYQFPTISSRRSKPQ